MVNEGEFKKTIRAWLSNFVPNIIAREMEKELLKIIEVAEKEFLFFFVAYSEDMSPGTKKELEKLIKKWFGDNP